MPYYLRTTITYTIAPNTYTHEYAIMDVDGDGDLDIIRAFFLSPPQNTGIPIVIMLNDGTGGFMDGTSIVFPSGAPLTVHPRGIAIADYNRDGRPDLFIADHGYDGLPFPGAQNTLLLSSGANGFVDATGRLPQLSDYTHSTAAGDIDGDGDSDILVMNVHGGTPVSGTLTDSYILVNDGTGNFVRHDDLLPASVATRPPGGKYTSVLFFDADGDGDQDLFLGAHGGESATNFSRILYNNGTGNFSAAVSVDLPTGPWSPATAGAVAVTSADLNGDGRLDLIVDLQNNYQGHYIQLLINHGAGGFVDETGVRMPQSTANDGRWIHSVQAVDLNGDGHVDLIARNGQFPPIFLNDGTGHFVNLPASFLDYSGFGTPEGVNLSAIDANGDGRMDLIGDFNGGWMFLFTQQDPGPSQTGTESADALLGDGDAETLSGLGGDDVIFGGAGADVITGGAGADTLVGGAGADLFIDSAAGLNGDTIRGFASGDRLVISDATLTGFAFNLTGSTLTYTGGTLTLPGGVSGTLVASAAAGGGVQLVLSAIADVRNDFNGDGRSDVSWRNVDGQISNWLGQANGGFVQNNANAAAVVPVAWQIAGTGDFNGDGRDDILWRNIDGQLSNWLATASGGFIQNNANAAVVVATSWSVVGTGDFNGDGRDDILWRNTDGTVTDWLGTAAGGFTANDANAARFVPTSWTVVGTGDFNGDGRDDILWRNSNGQLSDWLGQANGGFVLNDAVALTNVDTAWSVVGTGDFNGDGRDDILWRNSNGQLSNWLGQADGGFVNNGANSGTFVPLAWSVVAVGDYNGDGRDDILWRNTDGTLSNWLGTATGAFTPNDANAATAVPTSWHVQPEAPFL